MRLTSPTPRPGAAAACPAPVTPADLPKGWWVVVVERRHGKSAGQRDRYYHFGNKRLRSMAEVRRYLMRAAAAPAARETPAGLSLAAAPFSGRCPPFHSVGSVGCRGALCTGIRGGRGVSSADADERGKRGSLIGLY